MSDDLALEVRSRSERRTGPCELCGRGAPVSFHHLIPRHCHRKPRYRRRYSRDELRTRGLYLCSLCHGGIHDLIPDEDELGAHYNTREALLAHEGIARHVAWARKQKWGGILRTRDASRAGAWGLAFGSTPGTRDQ